MLNKKETLNMDKIVIIDAHYITDIDESAVRVYYYDVEKEQYGKGNYSFTKFLPMIKKVLERFTKEELKQNTRKIFEKQVRFNAAVDEYIMAKKSGSLNISVTLKTLKKMPLEDLFKIKLEIFEEDVVQNSDNVELRSKLRKSNNIIELLHYYHLILNDTNVEPSEDEAETIEPLVNSDETVETSEDEAEIIEPLVNSDETVETSNEKLT